MFRGLGLRVWGFGGLVQVCVFFTQCCNISESLSYPSPASALNDLLYLAAAGNRPRSLKGSRACLEPESLHLNFEAKVLGLGLRVKEDSDISFKEKA